MNPAIALSSVVFPQPLGPTRVTNSPARMERSTVSVACTGPSAVSKKCRNPATTIFSRGPDAAIVFIRSRAAPRRAAPRAPGSVQLALAFGKRFWQRREVGEQLRILVHHALEHAVIIEVVRHERLRHLDEPALDHVIARQHQTVRRAHRDAWVPLQ